MLRVCFENDRSGTRVLKAATFEELLAKGKTKFNLQPDCVKIISTGGTHIEDDDGVEFAILKDLVLIFYIESVSTILIPSLMAPLSTECELSSDYSGTDGSSKEKPHFLAENIRLEAKIIENKNRLNIYKLPVKPMFRDVLHKLESFELGHKREDKAHRHVLLTGMTGAGKSLQINSMVNYIYGIRHQDNFRFKLIVESEELQERESANKDCALSMTSWIKSYTFNWQEGFAIPYSLTIFDTPGFADTGGKEYEKQFVTQMKQLFSNENICPTQELSNIGLILPATQARLTGELRDVFDDVFAMFGKDMKDNVFIFFTFSDSSSPPAMQVVIENKIPFKEGCSFQFNNSVVYASNDSNNEICWNPGYENMEKYFSALEMVLPVSLMLTKEVLETREYLRTALNGIQERIEEGLIKLHEMDNEIEALEIIEQKMKDNADYKHSVFETEYEHTSCDDLHCNCSTCERTCKIVSIWKEGAKLLGLFLAGVTISVLAFTNVLPGLDLKEFSKNVKSFCCGPGTCDICECPSDCHKTEYFKYKKTEVEKKITCEDIFKKYNLAKEETNAKKKLLQSQLSVYQKKQEEIYNLVIKANNCSNLLKQIAIRDSCLDTPGYIENMIEIEKWGRNINKQQRLCQLNHFKDMALTNVTSSDTYQMSDYEKRVTEKINSLADE